MIHSQTKRIKNIPHFILWRKTLSKRVSKKTEHRGGDHWVFQVLSCLLCSSKQVLPVTLLFPQLVNMMKSKTLNLNDKAAGIYLPCIINISTVENYWTNRLGRLTMINLIYVKISISILCFVFFKFLKECTFWENIRLKIQKM